MRRCFSSWVLIFFLISSIFSGLLFTFDPNDMVVEGVGLIETDTSVAEFVTANRQVTIASDGTLYVAYVNETGGNLFFEKSTDDGDTWTGLFNLSGSLSAIAYVCIAIDSNDKIYVAYQRTSAGLADTRGDTYVNWSADGGSSWAGQRVIDTAAGALPDGVAITVDDDDDVFVFGSGLLANTLSIKYRKFTNALGTWSSENTITSHHVGGVYHNYLYDAVALSNDSVYIFYRNHSTNPAVNGYDLDYYILNSALGVSGPYIVYESTVATDEVSMCSVCVDFDNKIHIVYTRENGTNGVFGIYYKYIENSVLSSEEEIHYDSSYTVDYVTISYTYQHNILEILWIADCLACSDTTIWRVSGSAGSWGADNQAVCGSDVITCVESIYQRYPYYNVLPWGIRFIFFNDTSDNLTYADSSMQLWYDDALDSGYGGDGYGYYTTINVYNESSPSTAIPNWSLVIYDSDNIIKHYNSSQNNPVVIYHSVYGFGDRYFQINATNYSSRTYYADIVTNVDYVIDAFLSPSATANIYTCIVVDDTDFYHPRYIDDAEMTITRHINSSMHEISSGHTDYSGRFYVSLIPGETYFVNITADGYLDSTHTYVPSSTVFEHTFHLTASTPTSKSYDDFYDNVSIDIDMVSAGCLQDGNITITYLDSNSSTTNTEMQLWERYGTTNSLLNTWSNTSNSFFNINGSINTSREHYLVLFFNNTADFMVSQPITIMIPAVDSPNCGLIDPFDLDDRISDIVGPFTIGDQEVPWPNIISIIIPIIILVSFGPYNTGIGIIGCGISMTMVQGFLDSIVSVSINWGIVGIGAFIVILGIVYMMTKGTGGDHL